MLLIIAWTGTTQQLSAQTTRTPAVLSVGIGFTVPLTWNTDLEIVSGKITAVPALSADVSVPLGGRTRLYVATELPKASEVTARHLGSAGYVVTYRHRDVPFTPLVGVLIHAEGRVQPLVLIGGGPILWRTATSLQRTGFRVSETPSISQNNDVAWALAGGFELEIAVNARTAIVARSRARYTWNPLDCGGCSRDPLRGYFGPFSLSTGVALRILTSNH